MAAPDPVRHAWQRYGPLGTDPFLAFLNTVDDPGKTRQQNALPDVATTVSWACAVGLVTDEEVRGGPVVSPAAYRRLLRLREAGWSVLSALACSGAPVDDDLADLHATVSRGLARSALVPSPTGGLRWTARPGPGLVLDRLCLAGLDLINGGELGRIVECDRCTALFLGGGRGPARRFCRPQTCGNRAKVERFRTVRADRPGAR